MRALKFRVPRQVSMIITMLQLSQMVIGCWINLQAWQYKESGEICLVTDENLKVSLIMYGTYFLLFAHFFLGSYILNARRGKNQSDKEQQKETGNVKKAE